MDWGWRYMLRTLRGGGGMLNGATGRLVLGQGAVLTGRDRVEAMFWSGIEPMYFETY